MRREDAIRIIEVELDLALEKWPDWPADPIHAAAVVAEEAGELVQAALDATYSADSDLENTKLQTEAAQVGAMAIRMLMGIDRYIPEKSKPIAKPW